MIRALAIAVLTLGSTCLPVLAADVGKPSPEFAIRYNDGTQKLLSSFRGKVVCLEFLHTTCPHCQQTSSEMSQLYTEFGSKGFQPLGVAWNDMANLLVPDFIKDFHINYPIGFAPREEVMAYLGFTAERSVVPQIVWIDRKGIVRSQTEAMGQTDLKLRGVPYWREMIETLTKEPGPAASRRPAPHRTVAKKS